MTTKPNVTYRLVLGHWAARANGVTAHGTTKTEAKRKLLDVLRRIGREAERPARPASEERTT